MLGDVIHELFGKNKNLFKWYNPGTWFDGWFYIFFIFFVGLVSIAGGIVWALLSIMVWFFKN